MEATVRDDNNNNIEGCAVPDDNGVVEAETGVEGRENASWEQRKLQAKYSIFWYFSRDVAGPLKITRYLNGCGFRIR